MALLFLADDIKDLPLELQGRAVNTNGKYAVPSGTEGFVPEQPEKLRNALQATRETNAKLTKHLTGYGWRVLETGDLLEGAEGAVKPEQARADRERISKLGNETKDVAKMREELQAEYTAKLQRDLKPYELAAREMEDALAEHLIARDWAIAIKAKGGDENTVAATQSLIRERARVEKTANGKYVARIYDENGKQMISRKPGSAEPMDVNEYAGLVRDNPVWKPNFPLPNRAGGSGATHTSGGGSAAGGGTNSDSSPELTGERALAAMMEGHLA